MSVLFPADSHPFSQIANDEGTSTLDAGIHAQFDVTQGLTLGTSVGQKVAARANRRSKLVTLGWARSNNGLGQFELLAYPASQKKNRIRRVDGSAGEERRRQLCARIIGLDHLAQAPRGQGER